MFERESVLAAAEQFLRDGRLRDAWRSLDRYSSNFPADTSRPNGLWEQARALSQEADLVGRVSIATWPDWALAAVSVTFDDRLPSHVDVVRPDLDRHQIPGTFFVIREHPSLTPLDRDSRKKWRSLARSCHEIGNHTDTHPPGLSGLSDAAIVNQLNSCDRFIQSLHPVLAVTGFSYPYGTAWA
ncbi:MAG: polysaccharide deacetylase family protein [Fuerstiella sp.]|nr:polysaccharide deacetylase family protein [Fuerstiella sp.]MCP4859478.1 polysaccharide deacetylase family protein [Fuerstiella sp.]